MEIRFEDSGGGVYILLSDQTDQTLRVLLQYIRLFLDQTDSSKENSPPSLVRVTMWFRYRYKYIQSVRHGHWPVWRLDKLDRQSLTRECRKKEQSIPYQYRDIHNDSLLPVSLQVQAVQSIALVVLI